MFFFNIGFTPLKLFLPRNTNINPAPREAISDVIMNGYKGVEVIGRSINIMEGPLALSAFPPFEDLL